MPITGHYRTPARPVRQLSSLRVRYLIAVSLLALLLGGSIWLLQHYITTVRVERSNAIEARHIAAFHSRLLREALLKVEDSVQRYLWAPSPQQRDAVHHNVELAQQRQQELTTLSWLQQGDVAGETRELTLDLQGLPERLDRMMEERLNRQLQFPAMTLIVEQVEPSNAQFLTATRLALAEGSDADTITALNGDLIKLRDSWLQMVAAFRTYFASRSGVLPVADTAQQEHDIELYYGQLQNRLTKIDTRLRTAPANLAVSDALQQMQQAATRWISAYRQVKALAPGDYWRLDLPFMQEQVEPLFADVWQRLQRLDQALERSASTDAALLAQASSNVIATLWALAGIALVFSLLGFFLFERSVLNPIALMAKALRDEAHGKPDPLLPAATTAETQHLVEAFTEMRRLVQERQHALEHQALHDTLTGLPNRTLLQDRLQQGINHLRRAGFGSVALLVMDLDGFKEINDTLGHPIGDGLLQQLAERLTREVREGDTVARLGGDEFAILLEDADETAARHKAARVLALLEHPFEVSGQSLYVAGSIGIALYPQHAVNPQELSRRADVAMYVAKRERNGIAVYDTSQDHYTLQRLARANDLRSAINNEHLQLYFQPQIDLHSGLFSGVEALLRWEHPQRGFISPEDFIPVAEQTGLIRHLTYWVLDQALARCAAWRNRGLPVGTVSVNLSAYNLQDPDLYLEVARLLKKWGVAPYRVILEITESSMMANPARAQATLEKLNDIGVLIAIDDFGTGYSSLSYLKQLPVDKLKIDKSFVMEMSEDENDAMIVRSTIDLAHNLGLEVVAEGVENTEALELLKILNCDGAQGYLIGRPMSVTTLEEWLLSSPYCEQFEQDPEPHAPDPGLPTTH